MGGYRAAKAAFEATERADGDPGWDCARSCLDLGANFGPAVFVTARSELAIEATGVEFITRNGGAGVWLRKGRSMKLRNMPDAFCVECGKPYFNMLPVTCKCFQPRGTRRCGGTIRSAKNVGDWVECTQCGAAGCSACKESGWVLKRGLFG
jgi:hypothetical protein